MCKISGFYTTWGKLSQKSRIWTTIVFTYPTVITKIWWYWHFSCVWNQHIKPLLENSAKGPLTQNLFCLFSTNSMTSTNFSYRKYIWKPQHHYVKCLSLSWAHTYSNTSAHISPLVCEIVCTFLQSCAQTELSHKLREKEMTESKETEEEHTGEGLKSVLHSHKEEETLTESEREREWLRDYRRSLTEELGKRTNWYEELNKWVLKQWEEPNKKKRTKVVAKAGMTEKKQRQTQWRDGLAVTCTLCSSSVKRVKRARVSENEMEG